MMSQLKAVILAAGKGTRMKSDLPKVVHTIEGKCLVDYAIEAAEGAGAGEICLVVGYKYEIVRETISHKDVNEEPEIPNFRQSRFRRGCCRTSSASVSPVWSASSAR